MTAGPQPAPPPSPHPDLDTLADLDAGVLEGAAADRVRAHVSGCARCEQALAALGGIRADLRALPAPPMPAAVAARLDSALADLRTAPPGRPVAAAAAARSAAPVADLDAVRERRSRRLAAAAMAAAAAFVLVVAGFSVVSLVRAGGGATDSAATGGGSGALEPGTVEEQKSAGGAGGPSAAAPYPAVPTYTSATLRAALTELEQEATELTSADASERAVLSGAMADTALRTACVETIPGHSGTLRAVRWISYEGQPAYVFLFEDAGQRTAYVVGEQCGRTPAVPATVLDTVR